MKLHIIAILFSFTFLFTSCNGNISDSDSILESFQGANSANYLVNVTANFPEREVIFSLDYHYNRDGNDRVLVTAPSEIEGIAFNVKGDAAELEFDGATLEMGRLNANGLSPLSALPSLITSWSDGNFSETENTRIFNRDATLVISRDMADEIALEFRTWFSKDEQTPLYAELFSDGERVVQCEFERVEYN